MVAGFAPGMTDTASIRDLLDFWFLPLGDPGHGKKRDIWWESTPEVDTGCDTTFPADTLCLTHVYFQHPYLEGADGFVLDQAGNFWVDANERNAVIFVSHGGGDATEVFRNPVDAVTLLRNAGPLEFPTSPVLMDHQLCTANSDGNRRDNSPSTDGEIGGPGEPKGKISCLDQRVTIPGMPLPIKN